MKIHVAGLLAVGIAGILPYPGYSEAGFAEWRGVGSCTSSGCHSRNSGGVNAAGNEYAVWSARDPHARAFQVLFDPRSLAIQERLNRADPSQKATTPGQNLQCIRCHVDPHADAAADEAPVWFSDGVGCESCHGGAGRWLAAHVGADWAGMTDEAKAERGFIDLNDLQKRGRACVGCHVGDGRAEVNHDLVAAGHPALLFEFSSFLDRYRPYQHWSEANDRRRDSAYEAETWAVGQAVSAEAALKLLAVRAERGKSWPEFAEYDCMSCHHDLDAAPPRNREIGLPVWSWYTALTPQLPEFSGDANGLRDKLRQEMERRNPDRNLVAAKADALAGAYREWLRRRAPGGAHAPDLSAALRWLTAPSAGNFGWEEARQRSFAISAYYRSLEYAEPRRGDEAVSALVDGLAEALRPLCGQETPRRFDAETVREYLHDIHRRLENR